MCPLRELSRFEVLDCEGVGEDCFFFEVADESVAGSGREEVGYEH